MPRLIYSLRFETERTGTEIIEFVVPLTPAGTCPGIRPIGKPRVVDLQRFKLAALSAYP